MNLVALMPVRSEDWCIGVSLRAALRWCDSVVVLNHASTDRTLDIIGEVADEHSGRVMLMHEPDGTWAEMAHRQRTLEAARKMGATHCAIVDADEILTGNLLGTIRQYIEALPAGSILNLPGYNLRCGIAKYHNNGTWGNRWFAVAFADDERLGWYGDKFHNREPMGAPLRQHMPIPQGHGGVMHLWGASERRLRAKHLAYCLTERTRWPHKPVEEIRRLYSLAIHGGRRDPSDTWTFANVPDSWWEPYQRLLPYLRIDSEPWQERWCRDVVAANPEIVQGLDTFGVL